MTEDWFTLVSDMLGNYSKVKLESEAYHTLLTAVYCTNPAEDDGCPVGLCPNPDVAGTLLRIAHYVTEFCLAILIYHAPKRVKDAFYYQMSTVYALLITCSVSLFQQNITRFHATVALTIGFSPVSLYFLFYSIRAFWGEHRLDAVLGKEKYLNRGLVFFAVATWISIAVYTSLESTKNRFTQKSCLSGTVQEVSAWGVLNPGEMGSLRLFLNPVFSLCTITAFSWFIAIVLARKEIWPPGERYRPRFVTVWKTIGRRYPFVFFMSIGVYPLTSWIWTTELTVWFWTYYLWTKAKNVGFVSIVFINETQISFSFGQTLALFIAVPPFLQVCQLVPQLWPWFINLTWVACCLKRKREAKQSAPTENPDLSHGTAYYTQLENPVSLEVRNDKFDEGRQETQGPGVRLEPNRYYGH